MLANQEFDLLAPGQESDAAKALQRKVLWQHSLLAEGSGQLLGLFRGLLGKIILKVNKIKGDNQLH